FKERNAVIDLGLIDPVVQIRKESGTGRSGWGEDIAPVRQPVSDDVAHIRLVARGSGKVELPTHEAVVEGGNRVISLDTRGEQGSLDEAQSLGGEEVGRPAVEAAELTGSLFGVMSQRIAEDQFMTLGQPHGGVEDSAQAGVLGVFAVIRIIRENERTLQAFPDVS